jgi:hypothetical protein
LPVSINEQAGSMLYFTHQDLFNTKKGAVQFQVGLPFLDYKSQGNF